MDLFLVPAGRRRYELYCEVEDHHPRADAGDRPGWRAAIGRQFHRTLAYLDVERRERLRRAAERERRTRLQALRDRLLGWLVERVAEQRLLWLLRSEHVVTAHHPSDMPADEVARFVRSELRRDSRRHLVWMIVDTGAWVASLPLTPIPGPNVFALYFSFRAIGHLLSWLGARHGLRRVEWAYASSVPLAELRRLSALKADDQMALAREVAARLNLRHLDTFLARIALASP